ncbi:MULTISPECIES: hypothetical protein [Flavobacteriaceae]|uniref:hypothetical protein n=1 Tax=Flavobacteriaceae TaxID=49546 RepID=UPI00234A0C72|nr:hypothetical protein [Muricauda sp. SP22]MDC6363806.1 hypothetical protein [Muricauda sp. SP22]
MELYKVGISVKKLRKKQSIITSMFNNWEGKYRGMNSSQLKKLKVELSNYKQMYSELALTTKSIIQD